MTISTTDSRVEYAGNGVTTVFPIPFRFLENSHIIALLVSSSGVSTTWALSTNYTLAGADADGGGTLTALVAPAVGTRLVIYRDVPATQETDYISGDPFPAESHERALDKLTMLAQQDEESLDRAIKLPVSDVGVSTTLPAASQRLDRLLSFDAATGAPEMSDFTHTQVSSAIAAAYSGAVGPLDALSFIQSGAGAVSRSAQAKAREHVHFEDFLPAGYVLDGSVNYRMEMLAAIAEVSNRGGGVIDISGGAFLCTGGHLALPEGVVIDGNWVGGAGERLGLDYTTFRGSIILDATSSIKPSRMAGVRKCVIRRDNLFVPTSLAEAGTLRAAFGGIAIDNGTGSATTGTYNDFIAEDNFIIGFGTAIRTAYAERPRIIGNKIDCTNGVDTSDVYDMSHVRGNHCWPFLTTHQSWTLTGAAGYRRNGTAFRFGRNGKPVDWPQASDNFAYGWDVGFQVEDSANAVFMNNGADNYAPGGDTSTIGLLVNGNSLDAKFIGFKGAAQGRGCVIDLDPALTTGANVALIGCQFWGNLTDHIVVSGGTATLIGNTMRGAVTGAGINITSGADGGYIAGNTFDAITTAMIIDPAVRDLFNIGDNNYPASTDATIGNRSSKVGQLGQHRFIKYSPDVASYELIGTKSRGTPASPVAVTSGDSAFLLEGRAYSGTQYGSVGYLLFQTEGAISSTATPGVAILATTAAGAVATTQRWALADSAGNMFPLTDNAYSLGKSGARTSAVWSATGAIQTSDADEKTGIADEVLGLDFINALRPVSYRWIVGGNRVVRQVYYNPDGSEVPEGEAPGSEAIPGPIITEAIPGARTHHGLLAQEVKAALPPGVDFAGHVMADPSDPDSQQALRYTEFIGPLIKAVQELSARIAALENS